MLLFKRVVNIINPDYKIHCNFCNISPQITKILSNLFSGHHYQEEF